MDIGDKVWYFKDTYSYLDAPSDATTYAGSQSPTTPKKQLVEGVIVSFTDNKVTVGVSQFGCIRDIHIVDRDKVYFTQKEAHAAQTQFEKDGLQVWG